MEAEILPDLFRTEYRKIVGVLCYLFGIEHIETAEDIVSDTFLAATELWNVNGLPENPTAWLYTVAKNKTRNYLKRSNLFEHKLAEQLKYLTSQSEEIEIDWSVKNIADSQLAMIFAVCQPSISSEAQVALALNLLCGFGVQEIADAFLTNKEVVYKRIKRAKERLKEENIKIEQPTAQQIEDRLDTVLTTIYLLFSEGYYSTGAQQTVLRKDLCAEAMRLCFLLAENEPTNKPSVNALLALMCFHVSRFEARLDESGEIILYQDQDEMLWNQELIARGRYFLNKASQGTQLTRYHLEAGIAYWHTQKEHTAEKWENILQLYNSLLILEYSPIAALNRTYVLSKTMGKQAAIAEALKLDLGRNHLYHSLLGNLYTGIEDHKALQHYEEALQLSRSVSDQKIILRNMEALKGAL